MNAPSLRLVLPSGSGSEFILKGLRAYAPTCDGRGRTPGAGKADQYGVEGGGGEVIETEGPDAPSIRLSLAASNCHNRDKNGGRLSPSIRLATPEGGTVANSLQISDALPALLVSFAYLEPFLKHQHLYHYRDWALDSGAFTVSRSGGKVDLQKFIDECLRLKSVDPTLAEIFALDVIDGGAKAAEEGLRNCAEMWRQGIEAIPCFHYGDPEEFLAECAKYPKMALGGLVGVKGKARTHWIDQAFARLWPKKVHGFGISGRKDLFRWPWHSVDATNWQIGPCKFGSWRSLGKLSIRGSKQDLRAEVEYYLKLEQDLRSR